MKHLLQQFHYFHYKCTNVMLMIDLMTSKICLNFYVVEIIC
jgi:hypothetical protein